MASQAEVDLVISTEGTLPELERDLARIVRTAEDGAQDIDLEASINVQGTIAQLSTDLTRIIQAAEASGSDIDVQAALDAQESLNNIRDGLGEVNRAVGASGIDEIDLVATLDFPASLANVQDAIRDLVATAEVTAPEIEIEAEVDQDGRAAFSLGRLARGLGRVAAPLGKVTAGLFGAGVAASSAAPLLAGVAGAVESIAPAAALAAPAILSVALATNTVKLAMIGVKEAVATAFDPEAKPEELSKALAKLAPEAREFVVELQGMRDGFKEVQQAVQNRFFEGLTFNLRTLAEDVLPELSNAGLRTATTLNLMARGAADAAVRLGRTGVLGQALEGATQGLENLVNLPSQAVTAFGQLAAAAAPAFDRVTSAVARAGGSISDKLTKAFESGALESAINGAVDAIVQLGRIAGNVFGGLGNIISGFQAQGAGLFGTLEKITQAFEDVTATTGFQQALKALSQTLTVVVDTVLPLVSTALQALGPVFQALAAPVQILVRALGDGLTRVVTALSPVLVALGNAFGQLVILVTPFIDLAADLLVAILPGLIPIFEALGQALNAMVPFAEALATSLSDALVPLFQRLATEVLPQVLPPLVELSTQLLPVLTGLIVALAPTLAELATKFGDIVVALTPLIVELVNLTIELGEKLAPVLKPLLDLIIRLVELGLKVFSAQISGVVIPAIQVLVQLLQGDFSGAWNTAKDAVSKADAKIREIIGRLLNEVKAKLGEMARAAIDKGRELVDGFGKEFNRIVGRAREIAGQIPGAVTTGLGNLGNLLVSAGGDIIQGLINGISGKLGRLREIASQAASIVSGTVKSVLGISSPSKVMREEGRDTMDGYILGLNDRLPDLSSQLQGIAATVPSFALPNGSTLALPQFGQQGAPHIQVFIGNEQLTARIDTRIIQNNAARDRVANQGVRR